MQVIGISGKARSGKDSLFAIAAIDGYERLSFAEELKARARQDLGLTADHTDGWLKETAISSLSGHSPREFLIDLGNLYRKYRPSFWVDIVLEKIEANPDKKYVVTDVRYPNEAEALRKIGGLLIRLERHSSRDGMVDDKTKASISETALDSYHTFNYVLDAEHNEKISDLEFFWNGIKAVEQERAK